MDIVVVVVVVINSLHPYRKCPMFWAGIEGCNSYHKMGSGIEVEGEIENCKPTFVARYL